MQQPADVRQGSEDESAAGDAEAESRVGEVPGADAKVEVVAEPPGGEVPGADVVLEVAVEAESRAGEVPGADAGAIDNWANHQAFLAQTELHPLVESHALTAHFHAVDLEFHPRWAGNLHLGQVVLLAHSLYHLLLLPVLSLLHSARKSENDLVVQICIIRIGS